MALLAAGAAAAPVDAQTLTVDRAVQLALQQSSQAIQAEAGVLDAKSGLWGAYSGVLPRVSANYNRSGRFVTGQESNSFDFDPVTGAVTVSRRTQDSDFHSTTPQLTGSWSGLNLANLSNLSAARSGIRAARLARASSRQDVVFGTKRQFYEVVKATHLLRVSGGALGLARDNERRVRALFEVGSVSRNDLLKAQVRTAQSELDSISKYHAVVSQRLALATQVGVDEARLGDVDTALVAEAHDYDESGLLAEAAKNRPDLLAAEARVKSAQAAVNAARFLRLPYLSLTGSLGFNTRSDNETTPSSAGDGPVNTDRVMSGALAVNWDLFDGFAADGRNASARAGLMRARDARDVLRRDLEGQVREALLAYHETLEGWKVAQRALDSAQESLKLTQQKYNVGSATILELIDAQVQLQQAQSDGVGALAGIRVAEAQLDKVRGRAQ